jgi:50S ribosomal protein uL3
MSTNVKGVLGTKLGMTQVWDENNKVIPVTVVQAGPCVVTQVRTPENDGYSAVQIAFGAIDPRKVTKPQAGHFAKAGVTPRRHLVEIRTEDATEYTLGQEIGVETFEVGQKIDAVGTTKGKGFAGVMKRHGFHGLRASHGVHRKHRSPGSIGLRCVSVARQAAIRDAVSSIRQRPAPYNDQSRSPRGARRRASITVSFHMRPPSTKPVETKKVARTPWRARMGAATSRLSA